MTRFAVFSLASIIIWGLYPLAVTFVDESYLSVLFLAQSLALLLWFAIMWGLRVRNLMFWRLRRTVRKLVLISGIANAAEYISFFAAFRLANPIVPTAIFELWIIFLVIFESLMWKIELKRKDIFLLLFAFLGAAICIVDPNEIGRTFGFDNRWAMLAIFSAAAMGLKSSVNNRLSVFLRRTSRPKSNIFNKGGDENQAYFLASLMPHFYSTQVSLILYAISILFLFFLPDSVLINREIFEIIDKQDFYISLVIGLFIIGIGAPIFIYALSIRPSSASASVFYFIPIFAVVSISIFYGESLTYYFSFGVALIISTSYLISLNSAALNSSMVSAISALVFGYVIVLLNDQNIDLTRGNNTFIVETSFVAFGLVIVFAIERTNQVRLMHHGALFDLSSKFVEASRNNNWSLRKVIEIQSRISEMDQTQDPLKRFYMNEKLVDIINSIGSSAEHSSRIMVNSLHTWLATKMNFFPRSHLFLIILFGFVISSQLVIFSESAERPIAFFSLILCAIVSYLVAFLWEQSHPYYSRHAATHLIHQRVLMQYKRDELEVVGGIHYIDILGKEVPVISGTASMIEEKIEHAQKRVEKYSGTVLLCLAIALCFYWIMLG